MDHATGKGGGTRGRAVSTWQVLAGFEAYENSAEGKKLRRKEEKAARKAAREARARMRYADSIGRLTCRLDRRRARVGQSGRAHLSARTVRARAPPPPPPTPPPPPRQSRRSSANYGSGWTRRAEKNSPRRRRRTWRGIWTSARRWGCRRVRLEWRSRRSHGRSARRRRVALPLRAHHVHARRARSISATCAWTQLCMCAAAV